MSQIRQLAAIMFTDIVGYTSLMGGNEKKAFEVLAKNRSIHKPIIQKFGGELIKELGDGALISFTTVSDAVYAAINIQEACKKNGEFSLRIGIHVGEIVREGNDVFGDAVNISSRIQGIAPVGGILVSEAVKNNLLNKPDIKTRFFRNEWLKNVKDVVALHEVMTGDNQEVAVSEKQNARFSASIAVLPFVNMSNDPENEYFCDGLAEELLNALAKISECKVAARTSAFSFKGKNADIAEIAKILNVQHIVEGSVRKSGQKLRITVQLINAQTGYHLWSERFDRELEDIFEIQDEITLAVVDALQIRLFGKTKQDVLKKGTNDPLAYASYLKGNFHLYRFTPDDQKLSIRHFNEAIRLDPGFAMAYAGLASAYQITEHWDEDTISKAEELLSKAIELDPDQAEANAAAGGLWYWSKRDIAKAEEFFSKAIKLNPNSVIVRHYHAWFSIATGRFNDAKVHLTHALSVDPISVVINADQGLPYYFSKQYSEALELLNHAMDLNPNFWYIYAKTGECLEGLGRYDEAVEAFRKAEALSFNSPTVGSLLVRSLAVAGREEEAVALMEKITAHATSPYFLALAFLGLKNKEEALSQLNKSVDVRDKWIGWICVDPRLDPVRNEPAFMEVIRRAGFGKFGSC